MTDYETVELTRDGDIGWLRLNRPDKLNSFTILMWQELRALGKELRDDPEAAVRLVYEEYCLRQECGLGTVDLGGLSIAQLTAREQQVLGLMVSGLDRNGIAKKLNQSPNTVRTHIRNVIVKLNCHSAIEAVAVGLRAGLRPN